MNCKGILRKPSPIKKRNISTNLVNAKQTSDNIRLIDHNHANDLDDGIDDFGSDISSSAAKYQASTMHTTQRLQNKLHYLKNLTVNDAKLSELSPRSKDFVAEKASKKLNIESSKKVYKHLPPVNVNDSVLEINRFSRRDRKATSVGLSSIDAEPTLLKYLKPSTPLEYQLKLNGLEEIHDENLDRKQLAHDNFQRLSSIYRKYLDPSQTI